MADSRPTPARKRKEPRSGAHFRSRVYVIRKPVATPAMEDITEGAARRRPESVAEVRSTAWEKSGLWFGLFQRSVFLRIPVVFIERLRGLG